MSRLRVALVHPYSWPQVRRGGERYLSDLRWYLDGAGHDVQVITSGEPAGPPDRSVQRLRHAVPGPLARRGVSPVDTFGARALPVLGRRRFDVVHALVPSAALAARLAGQRVVYTVLGHPTRDQFGRRPLDWRLFVAAVKTSQCVTALSTASALQVERLTGRRPEVLPPGVRLDRFPLEATPRSGVPQLLFSGDAGDPRKGVQWLLAAFQRLLEHRPDARLLLSGPADHDALMHRWGVRDQVRRAVDDLGAGELDDLPARYRAATLTVLPSRHEAFGLALVESLASGTPVVCCDDGGSPDVVDDPRVGRVVTADDVGALVTAVEEVIALAGRPETPPRCGEHARRWGWTEAIGPRHEDVYVAVARRRRHPAGR